MTEPPRYAHLSEMSPDWAEVAHDHEEAAKLADALYKLPLEEFRKVPYKPPPLPTNVPMPGHDLKITEDMVTVRDGHAIAIRVYEPLGPGDNRWTVGDPKTEEAQNRFIASKNGAVVVSFDYRRFDILPCQGSMMLRFCRAPEFQFPYALEDSYDVLRWCIDNAKSLQIDNTRIILGGGRAGANLAAALARILIDENIPGMVGQILNIPVTCHPDHFPRSKYEYTSYEQNSQAPIVSAARMRQYWANYLPGATTDARANILLASSFVGLPPALIQVAGMDPLRDEGLAFAEALKESG
ncbi:lipase esterase family protein [Pestalotiopsis sp. NC0098]|nr:lipase esterase family protein [Pestalotiopsis sp. NC0098]